MSLVYSVIGAFLTSIAYAMVLHSPRKTICVASCNGAIAWFSYQTLLPLFGTIASMYVASILMALGSHFLARKYSTPVTVILIPSFIPFVPGGDIYRCIYYLLQDQANLSLHYLGNTFIISGMIALGAMSVEICISFVHRKRKERNNR